jgi:hypothetical protein
VDSPYEYGGQDIYFGIRSVAAGFRIAAVPGMLAGHALMKTWGAYLVNDGHHVIEVRGAIERAAW